METRLEAKSVSYPVLVGDPVFSIKSTPARTAMMSTQLITLFSCHHDGHLKIKRGIVNFP
jgi:hypothetical protein